ncbi:MAG: hypothetical protein ABWX74_09915 [Aeromicrobium sp.]
MSASTRSTRDSWWRTAPVLTIAILALIISTAGGAYAVGKNSIGSKQLKKNAVSSSKIKDSSIQSSDVKNNTLTSSDVKNGSLTAGDFAPGQLAPVPAGSSRIHFVRMGAFGTVIATSPGVLTAKRASSGTYVIGLSFDASQCATVATPAVVPGINDVIAQASAIGSTVTVLTKSPDGPPFDREVSLTIVC